MNRSLLLLLLVTSRVALPAQTTAVTTAGAHDPTYLNLIYFWAPDSLIALEKVPAEMKMKMKALGFGGGGTAYVMEGARSPVRIKSGADVYILIPASRLGPGEYGFVNMMQMSSSGSHASYTFFTFGIDP